MPIRNSRRDFLKRAGLGLGALALAPMDKLPSPQFPTAERLGRLAFGSAEAHSKPDINSPIVTQIYRDTVVEWIRETVAATMDRNVINQRWIETPYGYLYAPLIQPVKNLPNAPMSVLPAGETGFWAEVTVPYVDLIIDNPPIRSPWAKTAINDLQLPPRLYYGQVAWFDAIRTNPNTGAVEYRFNEDNPHGYGYGDMFWAEASGLRMIAEDEVTPISPEVDPALKKIVININYQTLSCFEGAREVFFCRVSTGSLANPAIGLDDRYETPVGEMYVQWKIVSKSMGANSAENAAGYDTAAVPWSTFIATGGVAIHGAFWHNNFGTARSHGCINARPEDAKWIFRWTTPFVSLEQTEIRYTDWAQALAEGTHVTSIKQLY
ncbi:MAG: L,D-transpeptidase [Chloroflexota bacterium]